MGYSVKIFGNLNNENTLNTLEEFSQDENLGIADSVIVCMMSHGIDGHTFYTSDGKTISVYEIYDIFKDRRCPHLRGKPKVFFFNFCRGPRWETRARN
ncbi:Cysteine-type endopeptidase activity protein, partial [Halocaridina rubra]